MLQSVSKQSFKAVGAMYALLILVLSQPFAIEIRNSGLLVQHTILVPELRGSSLLRSSPTTLIGKFEASESDGC